MSGVIARWTTPSVRYKPEAVPLESITEAEITLKQLGRVLARKNLRDADIADGWIIWDFDQEETSRLRLLASVTVQVDYKTDTGRRYTTNPYECVVRESAVNEVI